MANTPTKAGPSLRLSLAVVAVGILLGIPATVKAALPIFRIVRSAPTMITPGTVRLHLASGHYRVFQNTENTGTIDPPEVTVTTADGSQVSTRGVSGVETITRDSITYEAVVAFTIRDGGTYQVRIQTPESDQVLIRRSVGDTLKESVPWILIAIAAGMTVVLGAVLAVVGIARRARPAHVSPTPAGWYADPGGSGRLRYWDGIRWTEHMS
ncbi:MAG: DUF2510 domain-containing protein [Acidimicrobiales bacterium]